MSKAQEALADVEVPLAGDQLQPVAPKYNGSGRRRIPAFMDIPAASFMAGYSERHFRRIIDDHQIPICQIGRKFFILGADFERWAQGKTVKIQNNGNHAKDLPPVVSSVRAFQAVIQRRYMCDPLNHSCEYFSRSSQVAFGMFVFLLHSDLKLKHEDISLIAGIKDVGYTSEVFYKFRNRVNFDRATWIEAREIREASEKYEQGLIEEEETGQPAAVDIMKDLQAQLPVKKLTLHFEQPLPTVPVESHRPASPAAKKIVSVLMRIVGDRKSFEPAVEAPEIKPQAVVTSEADIVREALRSSGSMIEAATKLRLKPRELLVKCQTLGLKDDLDRLLG